MRLSVLLTTYNRTEIALKTIAHVLENLEYEDYFFLIADDGSDEGHLATLCQACGPKFLDALDVQRKGVGVGMNWGLLRSVELGAEHIMILEDDWALVQKFNPAPAMGLLSDDHNDIGMIRYGYLSPGPRGEIITGSGKLWLKLQQYAEFQYTYAGHASIRHIKFHRYYGMFTEGLSPKLNELDFCAKVNAKPAGPRVAWCMDYGDQGPFVHIGAVSLGGIEPAK